MDACIRSPDACARSPDAWLAGLLAGWHVAVGRSRQVLQRQGLVECHATRGHIYMAVSRFLSSQEKRKDRPP